MVVVKFGLVGLLLSIPLSCGNSNDQTLNPDSGSSIPDICLKCDTPMPRYCANLVCPEPYDLEDDCLFFERSDCMYIRPCGHIFVEPDAGANNYPLKPSYRDAGPYLTTSSGGGRICGER